MLPELPIATPEEPLRILMSGCLAAQSCLWDGSSFGPESLSDELERFPNARTVTFCPEDFAKGTPRDLSNIHGGNGYDVLDGKARVLTEDGEDWTEAMVGAANKMLQVAQEEAVHLAILLDISAACGPQVIYDGHRTIEAKRHQKGPGVCAALLRRNGIAVICQRDYRALEHLYRHLDPSHQIDPEAIDFHENEWYRGYFGPSAKDVTHS